MTDFVLKDDYREDRDNCYRNNIQPIMEEIRSLNKNFNTFKEDFWKDYSSFKEEVAKLKGVIKDEVDKEFAKKADLTKLEKIVGKVFFTSVTSLIGFLVTVIIALLKTLGKGG